MNPGNPYLSFPQPVLPYNVAALDQALHPPGTDPNTIYRSYPLTHVGFQGQTQYEDPNASYQNWVTKQAEPIKYDNVSALLWIQCWPMCSHRILEFRCKLILTCEILLLSFDIWLIGNINLWFFLGLNEFDSLCLWVYGGFVILFLLQAIRVL